MTSDGSQPAVAPFGSWRSPIAIERIVAGTVRVGAPRIDEDGTPYWLEGRPEEGGVQRLVRRVGDRNEDVTPPGVNVRTRVHEYGGGAYLVDRGTVVYSSFSDARLYRLEPDEGPRALTAPGAFRYADFVLDRRRNRLIAVREDHSSAGNEAHSQASEPVNTLVAIPFHTGEADVVPGHGTVLVEGNDFYGYPRLSPDGARLAYLTWHHPDMPWDGTELRLADVRDDGSLENDVLVAGGRDESIFQPEWGPDGALYFSSDRSGWWNLYRVQVNDASAGDPEAVAPMEAEVGRPQWGLGMSIYGFDRDGAIVCAARRMSRDRVLRVAPGGEPEEIPSEANEIGNLVVREDTVLLSGGSPTRHPAVFRIDLATRDAEVMRESSPLDLDPAWISVPELIEFPTEGGRTAYALYYPPTNPEFRGPDGDRPPLIVNIHGGPTAPAGWTLDWSVQVFTSRGIAYVDVDYGGSTGYGREYMRRLDGQWGVVDVDDGINAARYLADRGDVDGDRLAIRGGSAGGYTTLTALATRDAFRAGISYFGIGDLIRFREDTHKFESRYDQRLIGPWPESEHLYRERSAINHLDGFNCPVLVLQGLDDRIVPPSQAEQIVEALRRKGLPVAYLAFEGEDHGFRTAANIVRSAEAELSFLAQVFRFTLADEVEPVRVEGLPTAAPA